MTATTAAPATTGTVVVYCRISSDGDGRGLGVERQREDCLRLAAILGLVVRPADVVIENDTSASGYSTKPRTKWAGVVDRVRSGEVTHVLAYSLSRLTRHMVEREELLELRRLGASFTTAQGQRIYPTMTAAEVHMIRMLGVNDSAESDLISERVRRAFEQNADAGTPHGPIAYGWDRSRTREGGSVDTLNEEEAEVIRDVARRIIAGDTLGTIVRDLNARGVAGPRGGTWHQPNLRKVMLRERNAARRVHHGEVVRTRREDGRAAWEPIYGDDVHDAVVAILTDPRRTPRRGAQRHLLSGLLTCGKCGSFRMYVVVPGRAVSGYACRDCRGVRRVQEALDLFVTEAVVKRMSRPNTLDWLALDAGELDAARDRLATLRGKADLFADMLASDEMTRDQFARANARLQDDIDEAQRAVDAARPLPGSVRGLLGHGSVKATRRAWDAMSLDAQRDAIRTLVSITVLPTKRRRLDPDSIRLDWRTA